MAQINIQGSLESKRIEQYGTDKKKTKANDSKESQKKEQAQKIDRLEMKMKDLNGAKALLDKVKNDEIPEKDIAKVMEYIRKVIENN